MNLDTVEYLVRAMLKAGVLREQIIQVSRNCEWLFGVDSKSDAERLAIECLDQHEKNPQ